MPTVAAGLPPMSTVGTPGGPMAPGCPVGSPTRAAGGTIWLPSIDLDRRAGDDVGPTGFELGGRVGRDLDRGALEGQGRLGVHVDGAGCRLTR